jgi:hypothetical protein
VNLWRGLVATGSLILLMLGMPASAARPEEDAIAPPAPISDYERAVDAAHDSGLRVWIEADLVRRWLAGPREFDDGVRRLQELGSRPGVVGVKIADELGYHDGLDSPKRARQFLDDAAAALRQALPGKLILVDMMVPALGCLPRHDPPVADAADCTRAQDEAFPQLALPAVDGYLRSGAIDVLDLSTGLRSDEVYRRWGVDSETAQRDAWREATTRGWGDFVRLQGRKAMAHSGTYQGSQQDAETAVRLFVDTPLEHGAVAVDVWTWRQFYQDDVVRLADPGLRTNPLWQALADRRTRGEELFTHLSPHSVESDLDGDLRMLSQVFTDLFIASGTG